MLLDERKDILSNAIRAGFRVFDTAATYGASPSALAQAIKESGISRDEFFIIYKISLCADVEASVLEAKRCVDCAIVQFDYVDVLMEHFANDSSFREYAEVLRYVKTKIGLNKVHFFGLSNVSDIEVFKSYTGEELPEVFFVQNQFNPFKLDLDIRRYCKNKIVYMGYSTLGGGQGSCGRYYDFNEHFRDPLKCFIKTHEKLIGGLTPQLLLLGWAYPQIDMIVVRASTPEHIEEDKESRIKQVTDILCSEKLYKGLCGVVGSVASEVVYSDSS